MKINYVICSLDCILEVVTKLASCSMVILVFFLVLSVLETILFYFIVQLLKQRALYSVRFLFFNFFVALVGKLFFLVVLGVLLVFVKNFVVCVVLSVLGILLLYLSFYCLCAGRLFHVPIIKMVSVFVVDKIAIVVFLLAAFFSTSFFVYKSYHLSGIAMEPIFKDGDHLLAQPFVHYLNRGDVVFIQDTTDNQRVYLVRIIGLPCEVVQVKDGRVFVQGNLFEEPYLVEGVKTYSNLISRVELESDEYFVLADNRPAAGADSRAFGAVKRASIVDKYWFSPDVFNGKGGYEEFKRMLSVEF
ncbi:MAG: signal peptidase I [bacterium]